MRVYFILSLSSFFFLYLFFGGTAVRRLSGSYEVLFCQSEGSHGVYDRRRIAIARRTEATPPAPPDIRAKRPFRVRTDIGSHDYQT